MKLRSNRMVGEWRADEGLGFSGDGERNGVAEMVVVRLSAKMTFLGWIAFVVLTRIIGEVCR